jgi:hypothetical protein
MLCSSVSIVTRLGDGQPTNHGSIPGSDKDVPLVHTVQTASGVHPFCPAGGGGVVGLFHQGMVRGVRFNLKYIGGTRTCGESLSELGLTERHERR